MSHYVLGKGGHIEVRGYDALFEQAPQATDEDQDVTCEACGWTGPKSETEETGQVSAMRVNGSVWLLLTFFRFRAVQHHLLETLAVQYKGNCRPSQRIRTTFQYIVSRRRNAQNSV